MRILFYSQHVLGIGHFFRSMELVKHLAPHEVLFVEGGEALQGLAPPPHVRKLQLPPIMMDAGFQQLLVSGASEEEVKQERTDTLLGTFDAFRPDVVITELFPFGRKKFGFELMPLLRKIKDGDRRTLVVCSLRDILVEKKDRQAFETRALDILNTHYHLLLIHSDPRLISLEESFSRMASIEIPFHYTGFVVRKPSRQPPPHRAEGGHILVASTGGGKVGGELLRSLLAALRRIEDPALRLRLFRGPFMEREEAEDLEELAAQDTRVQILPFSPDFLQELLQANLLVSMAGYNTCMDILATGIRALVYPFPQNWEQARRAAKLQELGLVRILPDLDPRFVSREILRSLDEKPLRSAAELDLNGARKSAELIRQYAIR